MEGCNDSYALYWNNHTRNMKSAFDVFRCDNELVDVTLSCEGKKIKAHKILLSACSVYFLDLFRDNPCQHPIIILRDVKYSIMVDILNFIYQGEVNVSYEYLNSFLKTAELLQIKGLADVENKLNTYSNNLNTEIRKKETENTEIDKQKEENIKINEKDLEIKSTCSKLEYENFDECSVPLETILNNSYDLSKVQQESLKKEIDDFSINMSTEFMDLNMRNNFSHNENVNNFNNSEDLMENFLNHSPKKKSCFPCRYCDKVFTHPNSLRLHIPKHSGNTSCVLCNAVLSRKYELKVHMRKKHNLELF